MGVLLLCILFSFWVVHMYMYLLTSGGELHSLYLEVCVVAFFVPLSLGCGL